MRPKILLLALLTLPSFTAQGQDNFKVLHAFGSGQDGAGVWSSVTLDKAGNVYGTSGGGGAYNGGTVFRLTPGSDGRWKEAILHSFGRGNDGAGPLGGLTLDAKGSLYGTTIDGGTHNRGTIFGLALGQRGWKEEILYNLCSRPMCADGAAPWGNLVIDADGNLYGTAGYALELSPSPKGWTETVLHQFTGKNGDGSALFAGPIRDAAGNLYGTTEHGGGDDGCGTVWELSPPTSAEGSGAQGWTEHILHRFGVDDDLAFPGLGQLAIDAKGNLYGAVLGGKYGAGVIYQLSRASSGPAASQEWRENIVYNFTGGDDGDFPEGVIIDSAGNLYGITGDGGAYGEGVVFELSPQSDGSWKYALLHTFTGSDGAEPVANPALGPDGKLYGTAETGGQYGGGVVFQLTP